MNITVQGRGIDVSPEIRDYLNKRLHRLERHLAKDASGVVEIMKAHARDASDRMVVQVTITTGSALLRAEQHAADPHTAIDAAVDVLDRQVERVKGRWARRGRSTLSQSLAATDGADATLLDEELGQVVKAKEFKVQPFAVEEASEQMELLGHDFYVFLNTATGRLGVVYRRRDGDYGLLDPQSP